MQMGTRCASITLARGAEAHVRRLLESEESPEGVVRPRMISPTDGPSLSGGDAHENLVMPNDVCNQCRTHRRGYLDLDYFMDGNADVDMNVVGTSDGM